MFSNHAELADVRRRLRRVELLLEAIATRLEIDPEAIRRAGHADVPEEVVALVAAGKKIQAIKVLREQRQLDLVAAKDIVDGLGE